MPLIRARLLAGIAVPAAAFLMSCAVGSAPADAENRGVVVGTASVVDGDGLELGGEKVRLFGVDAPEINQYCKRGDGTRWRCGQYATVELDRKAGGKRVRCVIRDRDRYGRAVGVCRVGDEDLAAWLVRSGWALAYRKYSEDYVSAEAAAKRAGRGVWGGRFEMPWQWRARTRALESKSSK